MIALLVALLCIPALAQLDTNAPEIGFRVKPAATLGRSNSLYSINMTASNDPDFSAQYENDAWGTVEVLSQWGISDYFDVGGSIPFHADHAGQSNAFGQGDARIFARMIYPPYPHQSFYDFGFDGSFSLPTGARNQGLFARKFTNNEFAYTSGDIDFSLLLLGSFDFRKTRSAIPLSLRFNLGEEFTGKASQEDFYKLGAGATFFLGDHFEWLLEGSGETKAISGISPADDPLRFSSAARLRTHGFLVTLAGDFSLTDADVYSDQPMAGIESTRMQPKYSLSLVLSYLIFHKKETDPDGDGLFGDKDACPQQKEDLDGFADNDGCPDLDNDQDGVADVQDKCPNLAEDHDGFQDSDGCPDPDNDDDGIADAVDSCKSDKEDVDGFRDADGCPDFDNDGDGIPDQQDRCPNTAEDRDGIEDADGCPDTDNDGDAIPDSMDKCPDQKETFNGFRDTDGCPDVKPREIKMGRTILGNVRFPQGSGVWLPDSRQEMDALAQSLEAFPEVEIQFHGHTDSYGSRGSNQLLSEKMARLAMDYLIRKGISGQRLSAIGFGEDKPVAPNNTAEGREQNRRIEILRTK